MYTGVHYITNTQEYITLPIASVNAFIFVISFKKESFFIVVGRYYKCRWGCVVLMVRSKSEAVDELILQGTFCNVLFLWLKMK